MNRFNFEYSVSNAFSNPQQILMPCVDGIPLTDLVKTFEMEQGWTQTGSYSGIMPKIHCYGSVEEYFLGLSRSTAWNWGKTALLTCDCGVPTCWPFMALIQELNGDVEPESGGSIEAGSELDSENAFELSEDHGTVTWSAFEQPHRPERDYSTFGSFLFARGPYRETIRDAETSILRYFEENQSG